MDALDSLLVSEVLIDPRQRAEDALNCGGQHFTDRATKRIARNIASEMNDDEDDQEGIRRPGHEPVVTVRFFVYNTIGERPK